jgi:hypothetical protein
MGREVPELGKRGFSDKNTKQCAKNGNSRVECDDDGKCLLSSSGDLGMMVPNLSTHGGLSHDVVNVK